MRLWVMPLFLLLFPIALQAQRSVQQPYEDTPSGLKRLMQDATKAIKEKDQGKLAALTSSMVIPDPQGWFSKVFGADIGTVYAASYAQDRDTLMGLLNRKLQEMQRLGGIDVIRFTNPCDTHADDRAYPLLLSRQALEALSEVTFHGGNDYESLRFFAFIDGAFRFTGDPDPYRKVATKANGSAGSAPGSVTIGETEQSARLVKQVNPIYPLQAVRELIQGDVVLHTLVGVDGTTRVLNVNKGRCILAQPAIDAVRQWQYNPMMMNGNPVEVDTTTTVHFSLHPN
jgi:hypothetical protein